MLFHRAVGYGDYVPKSLSERLFQAFLILLGVGIGSSLIGILNEHISNHNEATSEKRSIETTQKLQEMVAAGVDMQRKKIHHIKSGISVLHLRHTEYAQEERTSHNSQFDGDQPRFFIRRMKF